MWLSLYHPSQQYFARRTCKFWKIRWNELSEWAGTVLVHSSRNSSYSGRKLHNVIHGASVYVTKWKLSKFSQFFHQHRRCSHSGGNAEKKSVLHQNRDDLLRRAGVLRTLTNNYFLKPTDSETWLFNRSYHHWTDIKWENLVLWHSTVSTHKLPGIET